MQRLFLAAALLIVTACEPRPTYPPNTGPGIMLTPPTARLAVGDSVRFSVTIAIPGEADRRARWMSSDQQVVTADSLGFAHAKSPGTATVTVVSVAQPDTRASGIVTVTPAP